jgi:DNA primase catalytic core
MLRCPFHEDSTASLQISTAQNKYKCHACDKKGDVIQFVQDYEKLTKHEALVKCANMVNGSMSQLKPIIKPINQTSSSHLPSSDFLQKMFTSFRKGIFNSPPAKEYCKSRNLNYEKLQIGFNGGQFHHGARKDETLINTCLEHGLLIDKNQLARTGEKAYNVFGNKGIVFPLKNKENQIVSFYFRSTINNDASSPSPSGRVGVGKHFYLKNRQGLYPNYPNPDTKKLVLTEAIIDTASLLQIDEIKENYTLLTCYGTNGLNEEILNAIKPLKQLEEIIFFFDGDKAGSTATAKYSEILRELHPKAKISQIETPKDEDINSLIIGHESEILIHLIDQRKELPFLFSIEDISISIEEPIKQKITSEPKQPTTDNHQPTTFLKQDNLLQQINKLIEQSGIVGEANSRLLLFIIASSYKTKSPLHAIVQGSSGSGKTHLISKIADIIPQEDVLRFTRITESSLYNWGEYELVNKLLVIEDLDGLKEEAMFAMRELISNQRLSSSVSIKDKKGNIKSTKKEVKGVFSSLSATTKGETYEDNMSRSFLIAVDESTEQSKRIIQYQNKKYAGEIDPKQQEKAKYQLQQITRALKEYDVVNQYATQLELPEEVHKIRRLNEMFQSIIKQITIINQYQRRTQNGRIVTEIVDIENAVEILFESIILKID